MKGKNELDASSNHSRGSMPYKSKTPKGKTELDMSSNHSRGSMPYKSKTTKVHRISIGVLLEQDSSRSFTTPPMDEISVSSEMSGRSNGTDITMTSRGSRVSTVSKLPRNLGRAGSTRTFGRESSYRSVFSSHSSTCGSMLQDTSGVLDHTHVVTVTELWQKVKRVETFKEDMPEQCILRMLELDPATRANLRLPSLRHARYDVVSKAILKILEDTISVLGPDLEDMLEELHIVGQLCEQEGINPKLIAEASAAGLALLLGDNFPPEKKQMWKATFDFLAKRMKSYSDFGF